jgi:superfamily II DNA or RNA helicase
VLDEAHHYAAPEWGSLAARYVSSVRLGLTATPERADRTALGDLFDALAVAASVRDLTETGYLVPCDTIAPTRHLEGGIAVSPVAAYQRHAAGRRAVVFCANVRHAQETAAEFRAAGVTAACIDGEMAPGARDETLARFRSGELRVLTNVFVLTEGWDAPEAEVCILARGCSSAAMLLQAVGRVLRPAPGKSRALLIDLKGAVHLHGLPGDDREYSLSGRPIRKLESLTPLSQCRECGAVYRSAPTCVRCGARLPPPKLPRALRGELSQIYATAAGEEKREYLRRMHAEAKKRGYAPGWAVMKFKAKYGHWPQRRAA